MIELHSLESIVRPIAKRRGYSLRSDKDVLRIKHPDAPFFIEVRPTSNGILVKVGYEGLRDYIRDIIDAEEDPRSFIEDVLDEISMVAHEIYDALKRAGMNIKLDARTAVMDTLEELEEAEEE